MDVEVVSGIGEEAKPKACSSEIELDKEQDSAEKTLENDDGVQENGVRVSENGEKKTDDDDETKETGKNLNESEDCVMNGVSSLLKLKEDLQEENEDGEDDEEEEEEGEEHGYCVGDFVWGKIKNHPWWPGQIYDPSDASDLALKIKQEGKLLVAYFGDGTFAWCGASQLKPFAESFKECSKMSNSRSFLSAVEEAVEEMGRHIERILVCDCYEDKDKFDSRVVDNAGIKEGVLVRDVRRDMIASLLVGKHGEILEDVKGFAETVSFSGLLKLEILKRKVSAFYRSKRGYGLTEYHEPQSVPGLEDKNKSGDEEDEDENVNDVLEWRAKRFSVVVEAALDHEESSIQRSLEKCSGFPDHRLLHRRKDKSIADILETESAAKVRFETEPTDGDVKSGRKKTKHHGEVNGELENVTTTAPRRRRKNEVSEIEDAGHKQEEESSKGKTSRKRKKRDVDDDGGGNREECEKKEVSDLEIDIDSTPLASLRKRVMVDASDLEKNAGNSETATLSSERERKKSKYLSPDYLSDFSRKGRKASKIDSESSQVSSQSQAGEQMTDASGSLVAVEEDKLDKPCEPSFDNGLGREELSEELSNAVDFLRLGATPKEMQDLIPVSAQMVGPNKKKYSDVRKTSEPLGKKSRLEVDSNDLGPCQKLASISDDGDENVPPPEIEQKNEATTETGIKEGKNVVSTPETRKTCDDELDVSESNVDMINDGSKQSKCLLHEYSIIAGEKASSDEKLCSSEADKEDDVFVDDDNLIQKKLALGELTLKADNNEPNPHQKLASGDTNGDETSRAYKSKVLSPSDESNIHIAVREGSQGHDCLLHDNALASEETMKFSEQIDDSEKRNNDFGVGDVDYDYIKKRSEELKVLASSIMERILKAERTVAWLIERRAINREN